MKKLWGLLLGLSLTGLTSWAHAEPILSKIPLRELEQRGIDSRNFSIFHLAEDGRTILAFDEPDFLQKKKGIFQRLWLLKLNVDGKLESIKNYPLPIYRLEQANFTPDLKSVLLSSQRGSDIHRLNLEDGSLSLLQGHQAGQPGFRIHSDIFSLYGGKVYTIGYFYDADDVSGQEKMVEIDPSKTGVEAFTSLLDVEPIQKQLKNLRIASALHPQGMFYYCRESPSRWTVHRWNVNGLEKIDEGQDILGSWGEGPLGLYCLQRPSGCEVVLSNAQTGERNLIYTGPNPMLNPCLAKDGNTLVLGQETEPDKVTYWVAQDKDGFKLKPLAEGLPRCTIRISHDGQRVGLYHGVDGLRLFHLDK